MWQVPRSNIVPSFFADEFREGWLCFEETVKGHRLRLPAAQAPSDWEELSDIRLRQLLMMARGAKATGVTPRTVSQRRRDLEDAARPKPD